MEPAVEVDPELADFIDVLTAAGITVVDVPGGAVVAAATEPAGAVVVTVRQVEALARDADLGVGLAAPDLDAAIGEPLPGVSVSSMIGGYAASADTPGGMWTQSLLGAVDGVLPSATRIPSAALLLFTAEATRPSVDSAARVSGFRGGAAVPGSGSAMRVPVPDVGCGLVSGWVGVMLEQMFDAAALNTATWMPQWIAAGGVALAKAELLKMMSSHLPQLAMALVSVATIAMIASVLGSWTVAVTPASATDRFAVGTEPDRSNSFTATLTGSLSWPPYLQECAADLGITLPDPTGAGSPVAWEVDGFPQYGSEQQRAVVFDADGTARLEWITGREDSDAGEERIGIVTATARPDPELRAALVELASQAVGDVFISAVFLVGGVEVVAPDIVPVIGAATELTAQLDSADVAVTYHEEGCRTGAWSSVQYLADGQETSGGIGTMRLEFTDEEHGSAVFDPAIPVYARVLDPEAPPVRLDLSGGFTFRVDAAGTNGVIESGQGQITAYADLGSGWILAGEPLPFPGPGDTFGTSVFECTGDRLILRAEIGADWIYDRVG